MREIKFRAWNKETKEMLFDVWVNKHAIGVDSACNVIWSDEVVVPMQYTGFNDKNGKAIYEGDIVKAIRHPKRGPRIDAELQLTVIWDADSASFRFYFTKMGWSALYGLEDSYEVIGNIYENPELLKGDEA